MNIDISLYILKNPEYDKLYAIQDDRGLSPHTRVLFFCMVATGMYKLFTREDMEEFVFRMGLSMRHLKVVDNFFMSDYLFDFEDEGIHHRITMEDLLMHIGMKVTQYPGEPLNRKKWLGLIAHTWSGASFADFIFNSINPLKDLVSYTDEEGNTSLDLTTLEDRPSPQMINDAQIMAKSLVKDLPADPFNTFKEEHKDHLKEISDYLTFANSPMPVSFDFEGLPVDRQQAILKHMLPYFDEQYKEGMTLEDADKDHGDIIRKLIYLAWINANGFVYELAPGTFDPRVEIDIFDYEGLEGDGGVNLEIVFDMFSLEEIEKYLT